MSSDLSRSRKPEVASPRYRLHSYVGCYECGRAPARVRLAKRSICGVCWNKIAWLRWAMKELSLDEA